MSGPILHWMPRVRQDIKQCTDFVARQPWGKPHDRELDIRGGIRRVCRYPEDSRPELRLAETGLWLRRYRAAQFVIVYAYIPSKDSSLPDVVTIRAVRHVRVADVFAGVKEPPADGGPSGSAYPGEYMTEKNGSAAVAVASRTVDSDDPDTWDCIIEVESGALALGREGVFQFGREGFKEEGLFGHDASLDAALAEGF
jgi:hypothetical protein